jgi:Ubiquitin elongating factor core
MQWFIDCMLVNTGASALRPDATKVSSAFMLLNVQIVLLRLCEPFVIDEKKHHLIDPGFLTSSEAHCGVYATSGDDLVSRLGEVSAESAAGKYEPKNAFIPQCFFFCARSIQLGIVPLLSSHENLLRHISHTHWELSSQHRDIRSDPHFCILVSKQRSSEVAIFQEDLISDTMRFCNLMARVLHQMSDETLSQTPEHFVDNICDTLMSVAKMKPKLLRGLEIRYVFKLVVKLLSAKYATVRTCTIRSNLGRN